jgi:hypothetical protein
MQLSYDVLIGAATTALGTLLGAWVAPRITYRFQKKLLEQQIESSRRQAEQDAEFRKKMHEEQLGMFREFRNMMNTRFAILPGSIRDELRGNDSGKRAAE